MSINPSLADYLTLTPLAQPREAQVTTISVPVEIGTAKILFRSECGIERSPSEVP